MFGRRVRELRLLLKLSQEELAERAGLHRNYIGGIERGSTCWPVPGAGTRCA